MDVDELDPDADFYVKYLQPYVKMWQMSFLTSIGEFDDSLGDYREGDWLVFFLCSIFNIILLLNLLIAVISETYDNESGTAIENSYKEKVSNISLMQDSIIGIGQDETDAVSNLFLSWVITSQEID